VEGLPDTYDRDNRLVIKPLRERDNQKDVLHFAPPVKSKNRGSNQPVFNKVLGVVLIWLLE